MPFIRYLYLHEASFDARSTEREREREREKEREREREREVRTNKTINDHKRKQTILGSSS